MRTLNDLGARIAGIISDTVDGSTFLHQDIALEADDLEISCSSLDESSNAFELVEAILANLRPFLVQEIKYASAIPGPEL